MTVKPDARLSDTNWLTNAYDAEPGMDLVWLEGDDRERATIQKIRDVDGQTMLVTGSSALDAGRVNLTNRVVVE